MVRCGDAVQVLVGRNNRQNDELSHRVANPDDLWMHVRGVPGRWGVHMRIHNCTGVGSNGCIISFHEFVSAWPLT